MGAETATDQAALEGPLCDEVDAHLARSLRSIGDVVSLYEELENALARMDQAELTRIVARTRKDERPLAFWARRIARARGIEFRASVTLLPVHPRARRRSWLVWEAVAFALGFGVSFLLIVRGI